MVNDNDSKVLFGPCQVMWHWEEEFQFHVNFVADIDDPGERGEGSSLAEMAIHYCAMVDYRRFIESWSFISTLINRENE